MVFIEHGQRYFDWEKLLEELWFASVGRNSSKIILKTYFHKQNSAKVLKFRYRVWTSKALHSLAYSSRRPATTRNTDNLQTCRSYSDGLITDILIKSRCVLLHWELQTVLSRQNISFDACPFWKPYGKMSSSKFSPIKRGKIVEAY